LPDDGRGSGLAAQRLWLRRRRGGGVLSIL